MGRKRIDPKGTAVTVGVTMSRSDLAWLRKQADRQAKKAGTGAPSISAWIRKLIHEDRWVTSFVAGILKHKSVSRG